MFFVVEARKTYFFGRMVAYVRVVWWAIKAIYTLEALHVGVGKGRRMEKSKDKRAVDGASGKA